MEEFDWNKKRQVQTMTPNKIIQTVSLSPKEVITAGGNRMQAEQVIASLCVAVTELIRLNEESAHRINSMYERLGKTDARTGNQNGVKSEQPGTEMGEGRST